MHAAGETQDNATQALAVNKPSTVEACHTVINALASRLVSLQHAVDLLTERLAVNSRSSPKPPSSDCPGGGNRSQRRATQCRAKEGHPGAWCQAIPEAQVDVIEDCVPPPVCECGGAVNVRGKSVRYQVFDRPPVIAPQVAEYQLYEGVCADCWRVHESATLPAGGAPRAGAGGRAGHAAPDAADEDLPPATQLLGIDFSVSAISPQAHGKVAAALAAATDSLTHALVVVHMDKTHFGREGTPETGCGW